MSIINPEALQTEFWAHKCEAANDAIVYTPNRVRCFMCQKTKTESGARVITPEQQSL